MSDPSPELGAILMARSVAACLAAFRQAIAPFGIDAFASGEVDLAHRGRSMFFVMDWPEEWRRFYFSSGVLERDPIVDGLRFYDHPFTWSELRADRRLAPVGQEALDRIAAAGWRDGLAMPVPRGGTRYGLVSIVSRGLIAEGDKAAIVPILACFHSVIPNLVRKEGFSVPPAGLTPREIECIGHVVRGRTDAAIGSALGISAATAHEHVERAKRRLLTKTRAELAATAVSLGIVSA